VEGDEIIVSGTRIAVNHVCENGFLKALCDNTLLDDELANTCTLKQSSEGMLSSSTWSRQPTVESQASCQMSGGQGLWSSQQMAEGEPCCQMSSGQSAWSRQQTPEGPESQVSDQMSVYTTAPPDPLQRLFGEQCFAPRIPAAVSSTGWSTSGRAAPTVTPSSLCQGQRCPFCSISVSKDANFCFACGHAIRATPSIEAALRAASSAQAQRCCSGSGEPPKQATMCISKLSV